MTRTTLVASLAIGAAWGFVRGLGACGAGDTTGGAAASSPDGGVASADAGADGPEAGGGTCTLDAGSLHPVSGPGQVECFSPTSSAPCNTPEEACCAHIEPGFGYAGTCVAVSQECDGGVRNECDEKRDCAPGSVCCVTYDPKNGFDTRCQTSCASGSEMCHCDEDCAGTTCMPTVGACSNRGLFLSCGGACPP
jgi:hypothetical protein